MSCLVLPNLPCQNAPSHIHCGRPGAELLVHYLLLQSRMIALLSGFVTCLATHLHAGEKNLLDAQGRPDVVCSDIFA